MNKQALAPSRQDLSDVGFPALSPKQQGSGVGMPAGQMNADRAKQASRQGRKPFALTQQRTQHGNRPKQARPLPLGTDTLCPNLREELPIPDYELVTEQFLAWAKHTPDQIAVKGQSRAWTYAQVRQAAEQLARGLVAHGVMPGDVVAIHGHRCFGLVASMVGVLLSGGVLLTIDAALPTARQQVMLNEAKVKFVLVLTGEVEAITMTQLAVGERTVLAVAADTAAPDFAVAPATPLPMCAQTAPAYTVFTSGTTGVPKGILGVHRGLAHFLTWQRTTHAVQPSDRSALLTGLSFDVLLRDIFLPLTSGATLCIPPVQQELWATALFGWLQEQQITLLHTVPSLARTWLQDAPATAVSPSLRWTFFAGEPLVDTLVTEWRKHFPNSGVANFYGPSETTLAKCAYKVPDPPQPGVQPIGTPLPQTQILLLDAAQNPCGVGELGEIVIRTPFRTLGYLNQVATNPFTPNPQRTDADDLLYHTGDQGRYRSDGLLEILGRLDDQIKIHGFRVEPVAIQAHLEQHPAVKAAVVVAQDEQVVPRLVAYVVLDAGQQVAPHTLQHYLQQHLPRALVPSHFIVLDALPLTPNGKVDRHALPSSTPKRPLLHTAYCAPRTVTEAHLATIWSALLGLKQVGVNDNFFELGGDSLLTIRLLAQLEHHFAHVPDLSGFFHTPTIAYLTDFLTGNDSTNTDGQPPESMGLSPKQRGALQQLQKQLADLRQPQIWQQVARQGQWHRRRKGVSTLLQRLPHPLIYRLLAQLCQTTWWTNTLYAKQSSLTREFLALLADHCGPYPGAETDVVTRSMLCNLLHYYQIQPKQAASTQLVEGRATLAAAQAEGHGVILAHFHDTADLPLCLPMPSPVITVGSIQNYLAHIGLHTHPLENRFYTQQLERARRALMAGGTVNISPDGHRGDSTAIEFNFYGRRRPFRGGFAELALLTGAPVIAVRRKLDHRGNMLVKLVRLTDGEDKTTSHEKQVAWLISQYVALLHQMWAETPWMVPWYQMARHLAYPPSDGNELLEVEHLSQQAHP